MNKLTIQIFGMTLRANCREKKFKNLFIPGGDIPFHAFRLKDGLYTAYFDTDKKTVYQGSKETNMPASVQPIVLTDIIVERIRRYIQYPFSKESFPEAWAGPTLDPAFNLLIENRGHERKRQSAPNELKNGSGGFYIPVIKKSEMPLQTMFGHHGVQMTISAYAVGAPGTPSVFLQTEIKNNAASNNKSAAPGKIATTEMGKNQKEKLSGRKKNNALKKRG